MFFRSPQKEKAAPHFVKNKRGAVSVIFGLMVVPLLLFIGIALDFSRTTKGKASVTATLDAGLLYVAQLYAADPTVDVNQKLNDYFNNVYTIREVRGLNVTATVQNTNTFTGSASGNVPTTFMRLLNFTKVDFNITAKVSVPKMEVALVLDNTGSMDWAASGGGRKMDALIAAANDLVTELMPSGPTENMKIGIVPYARYVNVGVAKKTESWIQAPASGWSGWKGCVGSRSAPLDQTDSSYGTAIPAVQTNGCPTSKVKELTKVKAELTSVINNMAAQGYTYIPTGLLWGWRLLSDQAPFSEASPAGVSVTKAIVLMTDGDNTVKATYPKHEINCPSNICIPGPADIVTRAMCDNIRAAGITVYTVAFDVTAGAPGDLLMQYCATNPTTFYNATDAATLRLAFKNIAKSLKRLRVVG